MRNKFLIFVAVMGFVMISGGCEQEQIDYNEKEVNQEVQLYIGKSFSVSISEDETVDAEYLKRVKSGEIKKDVPYFNMLNEPALTNLIEYMENNEYEIVPGEYSINQGWGFRDGIFIVGDEPREILKFKKK